MLAWTPLKGRALKLVLPRTCPSLQVKASGRSDDNGIVQADINPMLQSFAEFEGRLGVMYAVDIWKSGHVVTGRQRTSHTRFLGVPPSAAGNGVYTPVIRTSISRRATARRMRAAVEDSFGSLPSCQLPTVDHVKSTWRGAPLGG